MNTLNLKTKFRIYPHTLLLNRNATPPSFLEIDPHSGTESNVSAPGVTALDLIARNTNTFFIHHVASIDVKKIIFWNRLISFLIGTQVPPMRDI